MTLFCSLHFWVWPGQSRLHLLLSGHPGHVSWARAGVSCAWNSQHCSQVQRGLPLVLGPLRVHTARDRTPGRGGRGCLQEGEGARGSLSVTQSEGAASVGGSQEPRAGRARQCSAGRRTHK